MKQIFFRLKLKGSGCVNFDEGKSHGLRLKKLGIIDPAVQIHDNVMFAKKHIYKTDQTYEYTDKGGNVCTRPVYDYKIKISADCLRHHIYEHEVDVVTPAVQMIDTMYCNYLLSPVGLTRGYLYTKATDDSSTLKKKSPLTISDAIQTNDAKSNLMEVRSTTGERNCLSFFTSEKIGDVEYQADGVIDLKTLSFISSDDRFGRKAINQEWCESELADKVLKSFYGEGASYDKGNFTSTTKYLTNTFSETGILLGNNVVEYLVKFILKNMLKVSIKRNNAWTRVDKLEIKFVNDPIADKFDDADGWVEIKTEDNIDDLHIVCDDFYTKSTEEDIRQLVEIDDKYKEITAANKKAKNKK